MNNSFIAPLLPFLLILYAPTSYSETNCETGDKITKYLYDHFRNLISNKLNKGYADIEIEHLWFVTDQFKSCSNANKIQDILEKKGYGRPSPLKYKILTIHENSNIVGYKTPFPTKDIDNPTVARKPNSVYENLGDVDEKKVKIENTKAHPENYLQDGYNIYNNSTPPAPIFEAVKVLPSYCTVTNSCKTGEPEDQESSPKK